MLKDWWATAPVFNKFMIYTAVSIYILSWFILAELTLLVNIPMLTFYNYQIWRIFTTPIVHLCNYIDIELI